MAAIPGKLSTKALSKHLQTVGAELHTTDEQGNPITKEAALARLLWDLALGGEKLVRNEEGTMKRIVTQPVAWAIQYLWDRTEGKAIATTTENETGIRAADKVRELAKNRLNGLAEKAVKKKPDLALAGPPKYQPKSNG